MLLKRVAPLVHLKTMSAMFVNHEEFVESRLYIVEEDSVESIKK